MAATMPPGFVFRRRPQPEADPIPADELSREYEKVVEWRLRNFGAIGLPYPLALELAMGRHSWHGVARALDQGATHDQIERIFL